MSKAKAIHWTLDGYRYHYGSYRVFTTRAEARIYAKRQGVPLRAIVTTFARVNSAIDDRNGELVTLGKIVHNQEPRK